MPEPVPSFEEMADAAIEADLNPTPTPVESAPPVIVPTPEVVPVAPVVPAAPAVDDPEPEVVEDPLLSGISKSLLGDEPIDPAPAAPTDPDQKPPGDGPQTPSAQKRWAEMRQYEKWKKENEPELVRLKAENEELKKKSDGDDPEKRQYKAQADQAMAALRVRDVKSTPEYVENISKPMDKIVELAQDIAKSNEIAENRVIAAIKEVDPKRQNELLTELAEGMNDLDKNRLFSMADKFGEFRSRGKYLEDNAKVALETLNKQREDARNKHFAGIEKVRTDALNAVAAEFKKTLFLMQPMDGQDAWNAGIGQIEELASKIKPEAMHPVSRAKLIYQGLLLPRSVELNQKIVKENQSLRRALAKSRKATPGAGAPVPAAPSAQSFEGMGFVEAMEKAKL